MRLLFDQWNKFDRVAVVQDLKRLCIVLQDHTTCILLTIHVQRLRYRIEDGRRLDF